MKIGLLVAALCVTALFVALGVWQLGAEQKRVMFAEFERRGNTAEVDLNQQGVDYSAALAGRQAAAEGRYRGATILLDNQVHRGRVTARK